MVLGAELLIGFIVVLLSPVRLFSPPANMRETEGEKVPAMAIRKCGREWFFRPGRVSTEAAAKGRRERKD